VDEEIIPPTQRSTPVEFAITPPQNENVIPTLVPPPILTPTETLNPPPKPSPNYKNSIVFVSDRDGNREIYRIDVDGSEETRLTENNENDLNPQWSYDKSHILFLSGDEFSNQLYSINPDGSGLTKLTPNITRISQCEWSPNSYLISCITRRDSIGDDVIIVDADRQTAETAYSAEGRVFDLAWSPAGDKIALATEDVGGILVYSIADDSINEYELGDGIVQKVAWSNNGNRLAYSFGSRNQDVLATLYTVKMDFSNPRKWIDEGGPEWVQAFSPRDDSVLLESSRDGHSQIYVFELGTKRLIQLTNMKANDNNSSSANRYPDYSKDGSRIVFMSIQEGQSDIYVMDSDGTRQRNLTNHPAGDWEPDW
jgi:Tol biopolymer transport system component